VSYRAFYLDHRRMLAEHQITLRLKAGASALVIFRSSAPIAGIAAGSKVRGTSNETS